MRTLGFPKDVNALLRAYSEGERDFRQWRVQGAIENFETHGGETDTGWPASLNRDLSNAVLAGADLSGAWLEKFNLRGAVLTDSNLTKACLAGANLDEADLSGSVLINATLTRARLTNANLSGAKFVETPPPLNTLLPVEWPSERANLTKADLTGAVFERPVLVNASLERAILKNVNLESADLRHARLNGCKAGGVVMRGADLTSACLDGADFSGANLQGAILQDADLEGTKLTGAQLADADLTDARFVPNLDHHYLGERPDHLIARYFAADLGGANLQRARLTRVNLRGSNLRNAVLVEANLEDANLHRACLVDADLSRASLDGANLRQANLTRAKLTGASLARANLAGANLSETDLRGVDLTDTNLSGAKLASATLDDAKLGEAGILALKRSRENVLRKAARAVQPAVRFTGYVGGRVLLLACCGVVLSTAVSPTLIVGLSSPTSQGWTMILAFGLYFGLPTILAAGMFALLPRLLPTYFRRYSRDRILADDKVHNLVDTLHSEAQFELKVHLPHLSRGHLATVAYVEASSDAWDREKVATALRAADYMASVRTRHHMVASLAVMFVAAGVAFLSAQMVRRFDSQSSVLLHWLAFLAVAALLNEFLGKVMYVERLKERRDGWRSACKTLLRRLRAISLEKPSV
jgi:uncharacterized protein YjbI with pentapeptide repeats